MSTNILQSILITGATSGLGRYLTHYFSMRYPEYKIVLFGRNEEKLNQLKSETEHNNCIIVVADFTDNNWVEQVDVSEIGEIRLLIHNAGLYDNHSILNSDSKNITQTISVNVISPLILTARLKNQITLRSHIVTIGSMGSWIGLGDVGVYSAAKHAVLGMSRSLREELKPIGAKVTCIMPGPINTNSWDGSSVNREELIQPDDIAKIIYSVMNLSSSTNVDEIIMNPVGFER